jgi:glycosyltransferase involved in cell wall biosynthesis
VSRRLLFLLPFPPDPEGVHGASRMTGQLLRELAGRNEVAALFLRAPDEAPIAPALAAQLAHAVEVARPSLHAGLGAQRTARRVLGLVGGRPLWATDWRVPELRQRLHSVVAEWQPDVLQAELLVMGQYLSSFGGLRPATVVVDHDPGAAAAAGLAARERGWRRAARLADAAAWRRYTRRVMGAADAAVAFTAGDLELLRRVGSRARLVRIAPGVALPAAAADPIGADPPRVLFVGSFIHPPNVDAAITLAETIFPTIRTRVPGVQLEIVGDAPPPAVRRLAGNGVVVTGRVADTRPHVEAAAVVAAPLRLGGGMRVKVLEALAAGKALVATPRAVAGLELEPGIHVALGESDGELADALAALLEDPVRRKLMGAAARAWAEDRLDWRHAAAAYERLYESLGDPR